MGFQRRSLEKQKMKQIGGKARFGVKRRGAGKHGKKWVEPKKKAQKKKGNGTKEKSRAPGKKANCQGQGKKRTSKKAGNQVTRDKPKQGSQGATLPYWTKSGPRPRGVENKRPRKKKRKFSKTPVGIKPVS